MLLLSWVKDKRITEAQITAIFSVLPNLLQKKLRTKRAGTGQGCLCAGNDIGVQGI